MTNGEILLLSPSELAAEILRGIDDLPAEVQSVRRHMADRVAEMGRNPYVNATDVRVGDVVEAPERDGGSMTVESISFAHTGGRRIVGVPAGPSTRGARLILVTQPGAILRRFHASHSTTAAAPSTSVAAPDFSDMPLFATALA